MCTAMTFPQGGEHYFGRTLDLDRSLGERVVAAPRNYPLRFRAAGTLERHYAMIGMALAGEDYPLYYEAANEAGLAMAGLNFPGNARYAAPAEGRDNVASFELIPWMLGQCADVEQAEGLLARLNLTDASFREDLPPAPLHWMLADGRRTIVVEAMEDGMHIHPNPAGVLTNNPPFPFQMHHLRQYLNLTREEPVNRFAPALDLAPDCLGMGAVGLPGDLSSPSRFVRAAFRGRRRRSGSPRSSISWTPWPRPAAWPGRGRTALSTRCTPAAATPAGGSTTTPPMRTGRSARRGWTRWTWRAAACPPGPWSGGSGSGRRAGRRIEALPSFRGKPAARPAGDGRTAESFRRTGAARLGSPGHPVCGTCRAVPVTSGRSHRPRSSS